MAKNVKINGVTYENVPQVEIPLAQGSGSAVFFDTGAANAAAGDILSGKTAFGPNGPVSGGMANNGAQSGTISTKDGTVAILAGYHNGSGSVGLDATEKGKLDSGNIRNSVTLFGVPGKASVVDTDDADATAAQILAGKTAYVNGTKLTGTMTAATVSQNSTTKVLSIA